MVGDTISHYKILEKLGEGGMGVVYKAEDLKLGRTVALKFLHPDLTRDGEAKQRFIQEARAASSLQHQNICTIHDIDETPDGRLFIVMDYYQGETLKETVGSGQPAIGSRPLAVDRVIEIAIQIATGLKEAHDRGIVHRDIKPANIMITKKGEVKIMDFGLAQLSGGSKLTKTGTTVGTVAYMSPEQIRGNRVDNRADIWSLGALLYEMLTGQLPFQGEYEQAVIYNITSEAPAPVTGLRTGIPLSLEAVVMKCLEKDPSRRYQHAEDLAVDFKRLDQAPSQPKVKRPPVSLQRKIRWAFALIGIFIVSIALYLFSLYGPFSRPGPADDGLQMKIVVLPFENMGHEEEAYFAEGITEEITTNLASLRNLGVISRTSAAHYAGSKVSTEQLGKELGVDFILTGTVRWASVPEGDHRVRITSHLIRVEDDIEIWAQTYEHVLADIFKIQSDMAHEVVNALGIKLLQSHRDKFAEEPTKNIEAYQAYLRGRYLINRPHFSEKDWTRAVSNFQQAVEIDSLFALAYAELAKVHARLYYLRYDLSENRLRLADDAAAEAIRLDPQSGKVRLALGYYYLWAYRDRSRALEEWALAEKEIPNHVDILKAKQLANEPLGLWDESIRIAKRAFEVSPRDSYWPTRLALFHWVTRKYKQAADYADQAITLGPDEVWPYIYKTFIYLTVKGPDEKSRAILEASPLDMDHEFYIWIWYFHLVGERRFQGALDLLERTPGEWSKHKMMAIPKAMLAGFVYDVLDENEKARQCFARSIPLLREAIYKYPNDPRYHSSLGEALAGIGKQDEALREGKRAVELLPLSKNKAYGTSYVMDMAVIHALLGDVHAACEQIEILLKMDSWFTPLYFYMDIRIARLYGEPEFESLMNKYKIKEF
ncbi:protein kinase [candidate division KSB1 bacterium]|nr:protein kinase [candidate division KSB1 bacterium]